MEVNAVAVVSVATVDFEQALCAAAEERLTRGHEFVPSDADTDVLLLAINEGSGGHAGSIGLTLGAGLLTLGSGAVAPQSCGGGGNRKKSAHFENMTTQCANAHWVYRV